VAADAPFPAQTRLAEAIRQRNAGDVRAATGAFAAITQDFAGAADAASRNAVAEALLNLGHLLGDAGDAPAALEAYDRLIDGYSDAVFSVAYAWLFKADLLRDAGQRGPALDAYTSVCSVARPHIDADPAFAKPLENALMNLGLLHTAAGRVDDAVAAFDEVVARFEQPGGPLLGAAVHARYNRAVVLRDAGRAEAVPAYQSIVDDYATAADAGLQRWAGLAAYNLGLLLAGQGNAPAAADAFEALNRHFADSADPVVRERLAKGLYARALLFAGAGAPADAAAACAEIAQRFADEPSPVMRSVVNGARRRARLWQGLTEATFDGASAVVDLDPAVRLALESSGAGVAGVMNIIDDSDVGTRPEPLSLAEVVKAVQGPRYAADDDADIETKNWAAKRELLIAQLERDLKGHLRCGEILAAYLDASQPFALYLRSFDVEGYLSAATDDGGRALRVSVQFTDEGLLESSVAAGLGAALPFVGVGNNAPLRPDFEQKIPRMLLRNDGWQPVVEELIGAASLIVVHVVRLTPGVLWEIEAVQRIGAAERAVIVLSHERSVESISGVAEFLYGAGRSTHRLAAPDSPELAPFRRIIGEAEVTQDAATAPWAADLLAAVRAQRASPTRWDGVVF
jgi:tetratricopeptide (TPR) repeat protein